MMKKVIGSGELRIDRTKREGGLREQETFLTVQEMNSVMILTTEVSSAQDSALMDVKRDIVRTIDGGIR